MSSQHAGHEGHDDAEVHLPDPSIWPLFGGFAAFVIGAGLVFWSRNRGNDFAGPLLGAAVVLVLAAAAGWAWQDSIMRRKASEGHGERPRDARFTQVLTFAIPEGGFEVARAGVLNAIESADLRDLAGFQDLRIVASPVATGLSQVIVETTWSGREELETYSATRQSLLDLVASHAGEVVPGSVQTFDMQVVRDTKDTAVRFGLGATAAMFGALIVGGFMVGAGLTAFQSAGGAGEGGAVATPPPADPYTITARNLQWARTELVAPPNTQVTFTLENRDSAPHNLTFGTTQGGTDLVVGPNVAANASGQTTFTTPGPGTYYFICTIHPNMKGTLVVREGAPPPGGGPGGGGQPGGPPAGGNAVVATDNKFDNTQLTATVGQPFTLTLKNNGKVPHNIAFYTANDAKTPLTPDSKGAILTAGKSETVTFTPTAPGTYYYQCDLHPDQMKGTLIVK